MSAMPLSDQATLAKTVLERILSEMAFPATVAVEELPEQIVLTMSSAQPLGLLIGKGGQTLNALEVVLRAIVQHQGHPHAKRLVIDAEGYRQRQSDRLIEVARDAAERVKETGEPILLEPMNARDRRVVHMAIAEMDGVSTYSAGEEPYRHVVVCLPGQEITDED